MTFKPRTLSEIEQDALASARTRIPEGNWSKGTDNRARLALTSTTAWHLQAEMGRVERDLLPDTAGEAGLARWGQILRLPRNGATLAGRDVALRVRGIAGSTIPADTRLTYPPSGAQFQIPVAATIPAAGHLDLDLVSITTGALARLDAGEILEFDAAPPGIETEAALQRDLLGGLDREPLEQYRLRILRRFTESGALVTVGDWQAAAESLDTVDNAYVYPLRGGLGTVDLAVLRVGRGATRVVSEAENQEVFAFLAARRMVTLLGLRVLDVSTLPVDVELTLKERPGNSAAWDWGSARSVAIAAYDPETRTVTLGEQRPGDLRRGARVVLQDSAGQLDGSVSQVLETPGTDQIVLDEDYGFTSAGSDDLLWPAGDLTQPTRAAILAYLDGLGPALGQHGGDWQDSVRRSLLESAVFSAVPEVRDLEVLAPSHDIVPLDPPVAPTDDSVTLLVPGRVLVRRGQ